MLLAVVGMLASRDVRHLRAQARRSAEPTAHGRIAARDRPERPRRPLRLRRAGRPLVAGGEGPAGAAALARRAARRSATSASRCRTASSRRTSGCSTTSTCDSIAARERVTRHDVKARIEEFSALAGHEHIHKGMTSRDLTENVEQLQIRASLRADPRPDGRRAGPAGRAAPSSTPTWSWPAARTTSPAQATTLGKRFASAAEELLIAYERLDDLIGRYPLRGIKGPVGTAADQLDLLDGDAAKLAELERRVAAHLGFQRVLDQRRPGLPALARLRRGLRAGPGRRRRRRRWPPRSG